MGEMFYQPQMPATGKMWDTWLYWHEGTYYLYYLANSGAMWDNVSLATSPDGVHWKEHGPVLTKEPDVAWMGTGSTWASPDFDRDGKFFMNFSYSQGGQRICMAESTDLVNWRPMGAQYCTRPDTRWYKTADNDTARWDCIFTCPREEGGLWGYWTASPAAHHGVGHGCSADGATWEALPPPAIEPPLESPCEHGGVARVGETYYHMLGVNGSMIAYTAEAPGGPLVRQQRNSGLLTNNGWGKLHTYFSRFFHSPDGLLVNHHAIGRQAPVSGPLDRMVYFGLLKRAVFDADGTMRLAWWAGNDALKAQALNIAPPRGAAPGGAAAPRVPGIAMDSFKILAETLPTSEGIILEGVIALPPTPSARECGLFIRTGAGEGTAVLLNSAGAARLGQLKLYPGSFECEISIDRQYDFGPAPTFRLVLKRDLMEFYLADQLIHCFSLPSAAEGTIGFIGEVTDLHAWR
ncbi:MAG: family 43 glycosylhydrolase [Planctomycetaceae bacterium]|nr:family 43 glycosylhydrolase [Planctomycetaceae bacterium]